MVKGFVVNRGWRVRCCFRSGHLKKEAKKRRKGENEDLEEGYGDPENPEKQRLKAEKQGKQKVQKT